MRLALQSGEDSLWVSAVNNFAICAVHCKQITSAIGQLEALVARNPAAHMVDPVVFNVCTLYDLSFAPEQSTTKKKVLQRVAEMYSLEDPVLHWRSFRLN